MKKLLGLIALGLIIFIVIFRQRVFLRDPLANVMRDGHKQGDVKVFINFNNDIVMDDASTATHRIYLVEGWNRTPVFLVGALKGVTGMAYMTDADRATGAPVMHNGKETPSALMTNKQVEFVDEDGSTVKVALR